MTHCLYPVKTRLFLVFVLLLTAWSFTFGTGISSGAKPAWVLQVTADLSAKVPTSDIESGYYYLLYDRQINIQSASYYFHYAKRIINQSGVESCSQLEFNYDKAYENLVIHEVKLIRNGQVINQLNLSKIKVIQKEKEMDELQYNEKMSGLLFLEDVKAGDVLEYSYTISSKNPLFDGKYSDDFEMQFSVPICSIYYSITAPENRKLYFKALNHGTLPDEKSEKGQHIYSWNLKNLKAMKMDEGTPSGYDPYPVTYVSEYASWKEVKAWGTSTYSAALNSSSSVKKKAIELAAGCTSDEEKIIRCLRYVQDQVRYLGIETGLNTHKPHMPAEVLKQGFGDCKDKAVLLCSLLKELGITAYPVLIKSTAPDAMAEFLPSPDVFNHACVAVRYKDAYHFYDPTISYQRGNFENTSFPNYKYGLIIGDSTDELTRIPFNASLTTHSMNERFMVGDTVSPTRLYVNTTFTGQEADDFRERCASSGLSEIQKTYLNYYSAVFKSVKISDSVTITMDDTVADKIATSESYILDDFWQHHPGKKHIWQLEFYASNFKSLLNIPKSRQRTMPIGITYPQNYTETYEIVMPEEWSVKDDAEVVSDSAFSFTYTANYIKSSNTIRLAYSFETKTGFNKSEWNKQYFDDMDKVTENLGYNIYINQSGKEPAESSVSFFMLFIFLLTLALGGVVCYKIYTTYDITGVYTGNEPEGFGGWLILPMIGVIISPLSIGYSIFTQNYFSAGMGDILFNSSSAGYSPPLGAMVVAEMFLNTVAWVLCIFTGILMFQKRSIFPRVYIAGLVMLLLLHIIDWFMAETTVVKSLVGNDNEEARAAGRALIQCCIWIPYMLNSDRVKRTFVRLHPKRSAESMREIFR